MLKRKFKTAVLKTITCPRCGEKYEVYLGVEEEGRSGAEICRASKNPNFANANGFIWCGARIAYEVGRSYTYVGVADMRQQPNRFRHVKSEQSEPTNGSEKPLDNR